MLFMLTNLKNISKLIFSLKKILNNQENQNQSMLIAQTPRLILRHFQPDELDVLAPILADPEVMRFSSIGQMTRSQTKELLNSILSSYQQRNYGLYAVIYRKNWQLIGFCGFSSQLIDEQQEVEIGYRLAQTYWGKGLATEAATAVRDYGISSLGFNRLISIIDPNNIRSIRVAQKVGMEYVKDSVYKEISVRIYCLTNRKNK